MKCCMEQLSGAGLQGGKVKGLSFKGLFKSLVFLGQFPETVLWNSFHGTRLGVSKFNVKAKLLLLMLLCVCVRLAWGGGSFFNSNDSARHVLV